MQQIYSTSLATNISSLALPSSDPLLPHSTSGSSLLDHPHRTPQAQLAPMATLLSPIFITLLATIGMVAVQTNAALVVLGYKYMAELGVSLRVIVAYRLILATVILVVSTLVGERYIKKLSAEDKLKLKMNWMVLLLSFLCGVFGGSLGSNLYVASLNSTSTTIATAISNLSPAVTFVLAVIFRREQLVISNWHGRAKIIGTVIVIAGAMILSYYKGAVVNIWPTNWQIETPASEKPSGPFQQSHKHSEFVGIILAFATSVSSSANIIIQDILLHRYPSQMRSTAFIVGMGAVQSAFYAGVTDRHIDDWKLDFTIIGAVLVYAAIAASGLAMVLTSWCISHKGSFFVSIFSPITLIVVAVLSPLLVGEPLHLGSLLGAVVIFCGIYLVIWGKQPAPAPQQRQEPQNLTV